MTPPTAPRLTGFRAWRYYAKFFRDAVGALMTMQAQYGSAVALREWVPFRKQNRWCLVLSGEEFNRRVLSDPDAFQSGGIAFRGRKGSILSRLNRGLVGMNGEGHRQQRRLVMPLFMPKAISEYYGPMVEVVNQQLDSWPVGKAADVARLVSRISLRLASCNLLRGDMERATRLGQMFEEHLRQSYSVGVLMLPFNLPGTPFRRLTRNAEQIASLLEQMIDERRSLSQNSDDMLDRLVKIHQADPMNMPRDTVVEQIAVLFAASHETVAKAVTWTLFLLAQHPAVMAELDHELQVGLGRAPPSLSDLGRLPLLDAVTKEAMRLFPPVPWAARKIRTETDLAGVPVRHSDYVVLNHFMTHRSADVFPQPLCFRPERWLETKPENYAYLPFSAGPRSCIGKALGTVTINLMVAMILQRFRLTVVPGSNISRSVQVTLAPKYGLPMIVERQDQRFAQTPVRGNVHQMVDLSAGQRRTATITVPVSSQPPRNGFRHVA